MKYVLLVVISIATALLSPNAYGQQGTVPKEFLKDLEYYIGDWSTKVTFGKQVVEGKWSAKWSAEGKCLVIHITGATLDKDDKGDQAKTFGTGVIGWDAPTKSMKEVSFWSNGDTYNARYTKTSDTTWEGEAKGVVEGKEYSEKVSLTRNDKDEFVWKAFEYVLGDEKQPDIVATLSKVRTGDKKPDHEKLEEAFGWLIGAWEVSGHHEQRGDWAMTFAFNWDIDGTVVDWRNDYESENSKWSAETRHYWDYVDKKIKNTTFLGWGGGPNQGSLKECGKNKVVWLSNHVAKDGSISQTEYHFSLRDDGKLLFLHFRVLDDGTKRENWRFELTKK